ncbi:MAG: hypothetical protein K2J60_13530, partial [Acetatifactor sp.]|nr:hypothetical protein [Acetatifactor sp.]
MTGRIRILEKEIGDDCRMIRENIAETEEKIAEACKRAGRDRSEVTLIAVSKTKPVEMLREAYDAGARDFGE